jgi:UDP-N-acetyl-D-galactosamine dehydrogenase
MNKKKENIELSIAIIGLGYVGLPLLLEFSKKIKCIGYDTDKERLLQLKKGIDQTGECDLSVDSSLKFTSNLNDLKKCNIFIITVPTPVTKNKVPDFSYLINASEAVGKCLKKNDIVIYESTVSPGATEEICIPILARTSNLIYNSDFFCGYSPERINPGDKLRTLTNIKKITSGSTPGTADRIDWLYNQIINAGTFKASSIKVAEMAKIIENTQRDINIALINEISIICNKLRIDTTEVLLAAETKWNFISYRPGLVGGHCIGVDSCYLTNKSYEIGYIPELITAARKVNDGMSTYVANNLIKFMCNKGIPIYSSNILILGITFKENCKDIRNSRVPEIYDELLGFGATVDIYDPHADDKATFKEYKINLVKNLKNKKYDAVLVAVSHKEFKSFFSDKIIKFLKSKHVIYDIKSLLDKSISDARL